MAKKQKRERRGPGERWEPLMALWRSASGEEFRECWLVSTRFAAGVRALLMELNAERLHSGYAGSMDMDDLSETEISDEARRACENAGDAAVMFAFEGGAEQEAGALEPLLEELEALKKEGLALGPARLARREDERVFEIDSAMACLAMRERALMERESAAAKPGRGVKGPGARL